MLPWILLLGTIVAWAVVELYLVATGRPTISAAFRDLYAKWPSFGVLFALVTGLLIGHFFFQ